MESRLSRTTAEALRTAARIACEEALAVAQADEVDGCPDPRYTTINWPQAALRIVHEVIAQVAQAQYMRQHIAQLPPELLALVFKPLYDSDRLSAVLTCRLWRDTLFGTPTLWTDVDFNKSRSSGALARYVSLSGNLPLETLDVLFTTASNVEACDVLAKNISRTRRLSVRIDHQPATPEDQHRLNLALSYPAPMLTMLRLYDYGGRWNNDRDDDIHMFRNVAPMLSVLKIHCHIGALQGSAGALANVKQALYSSSETLVAETISQFVDLCPALEQLGVEVDEWENRLLDTPITLPAPLVEFNVVANQTEFEPAELLASFDLSAISRIWISYNSGAFPADINNTLALFLPPNLAPIRTLQMFGSTFADSTFNMRLLTDNLQPHNPAAFNRRTIQRYILDACIDAQMPAVKELVQDVLTLYVGERIFYMDALLNEATLPKVETLVLCIMTPTSYASHGDCSIFFPVDENERRLPLNFPRLHNVVLAAREEGNNVKLDPALVLRFLQTYLVFDAPRLPVLVLQGVHLLEYSAQDVAALLSYVDELQVFAGPLEMNWTNSDLLHWGYF
ncbi:hypothetical protein BKA62DRAFT_699189 [Auriculariales sp. MPI-PUGE-AT-0066]|nr:hypothetical protein BKA62DRAFT_699189 [Auriculariales sp. MPI-PUGE-AT-0066]